MNEVSLEELLQFLGELYVLKRSTEGRLEEFQKQVEDLLKQVSATKSEEQALASAKEKIARLENELQVLKQDHNNLATQLRAKEDYIAWMEREAKAALEEKEALKRKLLEMEAQIQSLMAESEKTKVRKKNAKPDQN
jgi:hypothetical protein